MTNTDFIEGQSTSVHHDTILCLTEYLQDISEFIDDASTELWAINRHIYENPELGYEEHQAHALLTSYMKARSGWEVTTSAYGLATAWVATYDSGRKGHVVSFNIEMDALPGMGHACGHNLIAIASLAAGLAMAGMIQSHQLAGKVVLFGTPAEEGGGGKIRLLEAGAYEDHGVDISLISHPGITNDSALVHTTAYSRFKVEYFGKAAHAANSPWQGINALDALIIAYSGISVLRQQTMPGDVIQGHITDGGTTPNVIHAYAAGTFVVRASTSSRLDALRQKVEACFRAGAEATGSRLKITQQETYADHIPNRPLAASYARYWNCLDPPRRIPTEMDHVTTEVTASTDQGNVSHAMPSLNVSFTIPSGPAHTGPHSPDFAIVAGTEEAFRCSLRTAKALAGTALDVLTIPGLMKQVKEQWENDMRTAN